MMRELHVTRGTTIFMSASNLPLRVLAEDGHLYHMYPIKKNADPNIKVASEILSNHFLHAWNIRNPLISGLYLHPQLAKDHRPQYRDGFMYVAYKKMDKAIQFSRILDDGHYWTFRSFDRPDDLIKIGLWDLWLNNEHRINDKINLLIDTTPNGRLGIIPIRHDDIIPVLIKNKWERNVTYDEGKSVLDLQLAAKTFFHLNKKLGINYWQGEFNRAIDVCQQQFTEIVKSINGSPKVDPRLWNQLYIFLFDPKRNKEVFSKFLEIMKK